MPALKNAVSYHKASLEKRLAHCLWNELHAHCPWEQEIYQFFGKTIPSPRLVAWYGDEDAHYKYSGKTHSPLPWTNILQKVRGEICSRCNHDFNSVLINYYRNGEDHMGWHQDNEPELGLNPVIASLSLGATRKMQFKRLADKEITNYLLEHNSLIVMKEDCQQLFQHRIPKMPKLNDARINLTFRKIHHSR